MYTNSYNLATIGSPSLKYMISPSAPLIGFKALHGGMDTDYKGNFSTTLCHSNQVSYNLSPIMHSIHIYIALEILITACVYMHGTNIFKLLLHVDQRVQLYEYIAIYVYALSVDFW